MELNRDILQARSFINNQWIGQSTTNILNVVNKFDQNIMATIPYTEGDEVEFAIASSVQGFQVYSKFSAMERHEFILKIRSGLMAEKEKFVDLIVSEAGKPIDYARAEVERSLMVLQLSAEEALRIQGEVVSMDYGAGIGKQAFTKRFPVGPVLAISPFNFPLNLVLHKVGPALAAGCSIILKPSLYTPLTALALASLCKRVGLPNGVFNVVVCQNEEVALMIKDERIKLLSFTGSAEVGWRLKAQAEKKKVVLELGGNASVIVDRSADLDEAAKAISFGSYNYAGQTCISVQRIFVDHSVFESFIEKFQLATSELKMGPPKMEGVTVGPLIDRSSLERLMGWIEEAKNEGAEVIFGGEIVDSVRNLLAPTLMTNTQEAMKIVSEEAFGPIAIIEKVNYFDEAIEAINRSRYGLQVGIYTNQISQMKYAFDNLIVGAVIINNVPGFRLDSMPYGGVKDSGMGREGVKYALEEMTESRLLVY